MLAEPRGVLKLACGVEFGMIAAGRRIDALRQRDPQVSVEADFTGFGARLRLSARTAAAPTSPPNARA